jgi:uncharacterized membrane-anchored protein YhcB (DUF1043 family)
MKGNNMSNQMFFEKVLPPIFVALAIGSITAAFSTHQSVQALTSKVEIHDKELVKINAELQSLKNHVVTRTELLETLKRVELQLQLMMAQASMKQKVSLQ